MSFLLGIIVVFSGLILVYLFIIGEEANKSYKFVTSPAVSLREQIAIDLVEAANVENPTISREDLVRSLTKPKSTSK